MIRRRELLQEEHSVRSASSRRSAYAGPTPLGQDGLPLKSCLSSSRRRSRHEYSSSLSTAASSTHPEYEHECEYKEEKDYYYCREAKHSVSFSMIEVRKYERTLGDHPCVSSGAPVALGWRYNQYDGMSVDEYEKTREPALQKEQMRIPHEVRVQMLLEHAQISAREVKEAELSAQKARKEMVKSIKKAKAARSNHLEEMKETAKRKLGRVVRGTGKKQEEDELWRNAHYAAVAKLEEVISAVWEPPMMSICTPRSA
mmetsp:Transcript_7604/g.10152  ORF Transcript_7604/g.10152 Transcript_7604/m.10152 type:complete len:257 (-) Transcript_7604:176-946(-)